MKILTLDTALNSMYITFSEDGKVVTSKIIESTKEKYHSAFIIPTIVEILKEQNLTMKDVQAIGVNVGPGSFTGIRAALTVAKVAAQQLSIPIVGISSLQILSLVNNTEKNSLCLLDARKNKAYTGIFDKNGAIIEKPYALEYEEVIELANSKDFYIVADNKMADMLDEQGISNDRFLSKNYDLGTNLSKLTSIELSENGGEQVFNAYSLKPLYIQPPPISMPKAVKQ